MSASEPLGDVINGVRVNVVAVLVAGKPLATATADERRIALKVQRVGEKLERKGYYPEFRREVMLETIVAEAKKCVPPRNPKLPMYDHPAAQAVGEKLAGGFLEELGPEPSDMDRAIAKHVATGLASIVLERGPHE